MYTVVPGSENDVILYYLFFNYVHITSSIRIRKDNGTETRTNVTTNEQALHRDAAVMVGH